MSVKYCLPCSLLLLARTITHPALRCLCDSWTSCSYLKKVQLVLEVHHVLLSTCSSSSSSNRVPARRSSRTATRVQVRDVEQRCRMVLRTIIADKKRCSGARWIKNKAGAIYISWIVFSRALKLSGGSWQTSTGVPEADCWHTSNHSNFFWINDATGNSRRGSALHWPRNRSISPASVIGYANTAKLTQGRETAGDHLADVRWHHDADPHPKITDRRRWLNVATATVPVTR